MAEFGVLLLVGLWTAIDPAGTLRWLLRLVADFQSGIQRFHRHLSGLDPRRFFAESPDFPAPSRGSQIAMRCFGVAVAIVGFLGLATRLA
jgi:hypothetical protein